ncbi:MAG: E3 ubiquitin protein ligase [Bacteroidales bacterium]|nr:E3 ubiquitin protein ligase [Candidatus Physcousia equi]
MNKTKQTNRVWAALLLLFVCLGSLQAQVSHIRFCDRKYEYGVGKDSITLFFNVLDENMERMTNLAQNDLQSHLTLKEDDKEIDASRCTITPVSSGKRIPAEFTFSVLIDQSMPEEGRSQIYMAVSQLLESAPDGCVYVSFFGDEVGSTTAVTAESLRQLRSEFNTVSDNKYFYSALYAKLCEFNTSSAEYEQSVKACIDYEKNADLAKRAAANPDKNILFVFTESNKMPAFEEDLDFVTVTEYQNGKTHIVPRVYAFYFTNGTEDNEDGMNIKSTLEALCSPKDADRRGALLPAHNMDQALSEFMRVVGDQMYDYILSYKADESKAYTGLVKYAAIWRGDKLGEGEFAIGSAERPWPERQASVGDSTIKYVMAIVVALLTILIFFLVMKVMVPAASQSKFKSKYYKRFVPDAAVSRRVCTYCRQEIQEGQFVVARCKHVMHANCWKENGYKCAEYGQNCNEGYQPHIIWSDVFTMRSVMECHQTLAGVLAALISWVLYEVLGGSLFDGIAAPLAKAFVGNETILGDCIAKTSAFLTIGALLGFFLSAIFRYNDEYRKKDAQVWLKIVGLSVLTAVIGMLAFAVGAILLCVVANAVGANYIPWYCSLPAYLLFSVCLSLALTIKSTIPLKSALLGGLLSALIGFVVLSFGSLFTGSWGWMGMLLNFIIYGGGLGAALVTVRMLAERYFLVFNVGTETKRIPIHKWMGATGGGKRVNIGMTNNCEIQMNWEKTNKVAKQHVQLYIDHERNLPMLKPLSATLYNGRTDLAINKPIVLCEGDTFKIGDTTFRYTEKMD